MDDLVALGVCMRIDAVHSDHPDHPDYVEAWRP